MKEKKLTLCKRLTIEKELIKYRDKKEQQFIELEQILEPLLMARAEDGEAIITDKQYTMEFLKNYCGFEVTVVVDPKSISNANVIDVVSEYKICW